jgi:hypothetical protein
VRKKSGKSCQIHTLGFHCVAKKRRKEGWWKIYNLFIVYSQIWLNLPRDDRHFSYNFLWWLPLWLQTKISKKKISGYVWDTKFQQEIICISYQNIWKRVLKLCNDRVSNSST